MTHVHFIGIGGTGLSAIATVLLQRGWMVSGSDRQSSPLLAGLEAAGARLYIGHAVENIRDADLVVRSSAVSDDNPEVQAAQAEGIPVLKRMEFLDRLLAGQEAIAVAGTHGKTTTTAMIAWVLVSLGADPSFVIGGVANNLGVNARAGQGRFFVIEADEYDYMFLGIHPSVAVVTNIEHDHPDCYPTADEFYAAFRRFAGNIFPRGVLIACGEDAGAKRLMEELRNNSVRRTVGEMQLHALRSYGIVGDWDYSARDLVVNKAGGLSFDVYRSGVLWQPGVSLQVPGEHNVRNALAALAAADWIGLPGQEAAKALGEFRGTGRRFELRGEVAGVALIDDYAHHPTEIRATLAAARLRYPGRRIWAVWQPHTYTRTRTLLPEFAKAFADADCVLVTEIYAAREAAPQDGFSSRALWEAIVREKVLSSAQQKSQPKARPAAQEKVFFAPSLTQAGDILLEELEPGDVVLVLSAGDADQITERLRRELPARRESTASSDRREENG